MMSGSNKWFLIHPYFSTLKISHIFIATVNDGLTMTYIYQNISAYKIYQLENIGFGHSSLSHSEM